MLQLYFQILYYSYILLLYFCKKGILKCFSLYTAIMLPRKSIVEVYYTCILLLYFTTEVKTEVYFDEYTSVILLSKSMIEVYFNHTTVTRSITEVYLLYT